MDYRDEGDKIMQDIILIEKQIERILDCKVVRSRDGLYTSTDKPVLVLEVKNNFDDSYHVVAIEHNGNPLMDTWHIMDFKDKLLEPITEEEFENLKNVDGYILI